MSMEWGLPHNFIWLWVLPAAAGIFFLSSWRRKAQMRRFGDIALVERLVTSFDPAKRLLKRALLIASLAFMVLALCQPHFKTKEVIVERKGIDITIAIDVSQSMMAKDVAPNRLEKAKLELATLVDRLRGDRIGVVAFAGEAFIQCPLTLDKGAVKLFLSTINPNLIPTPGTAIGSAIRVATQAFAEKEKEFKAIILLTDGEDQGSDPMGAARRAKEAGVRIFPIGLGTAEGSTLPGESAGEGFKKDRQGQAVLSKLDEPLLKKIAEETGGVYYRATRGELEIDGLLRELKKMSQKGLKSEKSIEYEEHFQYFLLAAFILLLFEMAISERRKSKEGPPTALVLLALCPFLSGFEFYSALKNEEGNKFYKSGQVGRAKNAYASALESEPASPEVAFNLGNAYYKEESFKESLEAYKKAAKEEKSPLLQSKAFYNLGNSLVRQEDDQKAIDFYKQALRLNPKDEDAKYNLELLLKRQNQDKQDKKEDQKKDQQQQQNKDKKDQKDQKQDPQQSQGGQDQKDKDQKGQNQQGQGQKDKDQKEQDQQNQGQQDQNQEGQDQQNKDQQQKPQDQGQKDQKDPSSGQDKEGQEKQEKEGQEESDNQESQKKDSEGKGAESKEQKEREEQAEGAGQEEQQPKTPAQIRAEQILAALENEEKQVLRMQAGQGKPFTRVKRIVEKDW